MKLELKDIKEGFLVKLNFDHNDIRYFSLSIRNSSEDTFWKVIRKIGDACVIKAPCGEENSVPQFSLIKEVKGYFSDGYKA